MPRPDLPKARPCPARKGRRPCRAHWPGHNLHDAHAQRIAETPWGWRIALITGLKAGVRGDVLDLSYVGGGTVQAWHHGRIAATFRLAQRVGVHEQFHALLVNDCLLNVFLTGGLGPVEPPTELGALFDGAADQ